MEPDKHLLLDHEGNRGQFDITEKWELKIAAALKTVPDRFEDDRRQAM